MATKAVLSSRLLSLLTINNSRCFSNSLVKLGLFGKKKKSVEEKQDMAVMRKEAQLAEVKHKTKTSFASLIQQFEESSPNRRGHVEFIYASLRVMKDFGVETDLESYKRLLSVFPKDKMVPKNSFQIEFMHFPLQQNCAVRLLDQMDEHGVIPDEDIQMIIMERFGYRGLPMRKFARMNYWMPKFRYASPWLLPKPVPDDPYELALLAIQRITSVDLQTKIETFQTSQVESSLDKTWIVSGQSPQQRQLLVKQPKDKALYIDGAFRVWLRNASIAYFVLRADPDADRLKSRISKEDLDDVSNLGNPYDGLHETSLTIDASVHQQEDANIFAICATGSSSRDSLLSWLRLLQTNNPVLEELPVIFTLKAPTTAVAPANVARTQEEKGETKAE